MKKSVCAAMTITTLLFTLGARSALAETLTISTEEYPPLNFSKDGKVTGSSTELLRKALDENKIEATITVYPWSRALDMATKDKNTCVYSTTRTAERETLFKWAGPLVNNEWVLLGRTDSPKLTSLDDAKAYTIGGYKDDALTNYLRGLGMNIEEAASDDLNPKKLAAKRIDFWATYKFEGQDLANKLGAAGLVESTKVKTVSMYLACNKSVSDETIAKLNASFKKMNDDGTIKATVKKYE